MSAGIYNFTIEQGTTVVKQFTYKDKLNTVIPLTGYDVRMHIRESISDGSTIDTFSTASDGGLTILATPETTASGTIGLRIEAAATTNYIFDTAVYDIELEDDEGTVTRLLQGSIRLSKQVTR